LLLTGSVLLTGCDMVVLRPSGYVAAQQSHLVVMSTLLMLLIIVPVIVLTLVFAWRLSSVEYGGSLYPRLGPFRPAGVADLGSAAADHHPAGSAHLDRHAYARPVSAADTDRCRAARARRTEPMVVEVVALDWKWLFIYPDLDIAVVNELAAPVDVPIRFKITASSVMNSFFIPALAGQIYAMPSMETTLHAVINRPGRVRGLFRQLQRRRLLRHALQVPRNERCRLRPLGAEGKSRGQRAESQRLSAAREAE
jgi:cytochrome o ubiquinol oxidase subunit 2